MNLRQVEAFQAIMITGSVTQAGKALFVSQPAVSRLIADLERKVGFKLFERKSRQLIPTEEGKALYQEVQRAFVGLSQIEEAARGIRQFQIGQLRLITIPILASRILPEFVSLFLEQYPGCAVSLEVRPSHRVAEWVVSQQCDLGISTLPIEHPGTTAVPFMRGDSVCILPADHPLAAKSEIHASDLEGEPFVSYRPDSVSRYRIDEIFHKAGVTRNLKLEARTSDAICALVAAGLGISVIGPILPQFFKMEGVVFRPFEPNFSFELAVLKPAYRPISIIAERFVSVITTYAATHRLPSAGDAV